MDISNLKDGEKILEFFVPGRPATKKTSQRIVRRGRFTKILPSKTLGKISDTNRCLMVFQ